METKVKDAILKAVESESAEELLEFVEAGVESGEFDVKLLEFVKDFGVQSFLEGFTRATALNHMASEMRILRWRDEDWFIFNLKLNIVGEGEAYMMNFEGEIVDLLDQEVFEEAYITDSIVDPEFVAENITVSKGHIIGGEKIESRGLN